MSVVFIQLAIYLDDLLNLTRINAYHKSSQVTFLARTMHNILMLPIQALPSLFVVERLGSCVLLKRNSV